MSIRPADQERHITPPLIPLIRKKGRECPTVRRFAPFIQRNKAGAVRRSVQQQRAFSGRAPALFVLNLDDGQGAKSQTSP